MAPIQPVSPVTCHDDVTLYTGLHWSIVQLLAVFVALICKTMQPVIWLLLESIIIFRSCTFIIQRAADVGINTSLVLLSEMGGILGLTRFASFLVDELDVSGKIKRWKFIGSDSVIFGLVANFCIRNLAAISVFCNLHMHDYAVNYEACLNNM